MKTLNYGNYWNSALTFGVTRAFTENTFDEVMRITSSGKVGIGTTNPVSGVLDVVSPDVSVASFKSNTAGNYANIYISSNDQTFTINQNSSTRPGAVVSGINLAGTSILQADGVDLIMHMAAEGKNFHITGTNSGISQANFTALAGGNVGIGTTTPTEKLSVNGRIRAHEVKVEAANWPDYVFKKGYELEKLEKLERFITVNRHLPEIPSAGEVEKEGISLGEMNAKLLKKIEELTLYLIEQNKRSEEHERWRNEQAEHIKELQKQIKRLESKL